MPGCLPRSVQKKNVCKESSDQYNSVDILQCLYSPHAWGGGGGGKSSMKGGRVLPLVHMKNKVSLCKYVKKCRQEYVHFIRNLPFHHLTIFFCCCWQLSSGSLVDEADIVTNRSSVVFLTGGLKN